MWCEYILEKTESRKENDEGTETLMEPRKQRKELFCLQLEQLHNGTVSVRRAKTKRATKFIFLPRLMAQ